MDFGAIPIVSLAQAGLPGVASNIGSAAVGAIPWIEAAIVAGAIMPYSGRKRSRSGGYGRMNTMAGRYYGKVAIGRSLTIRGTHTFKRSLQIPIQYVPTTGFQSGTASLNMAVSFSLSQVKVTTGTAVQFAVPGASDLINLFDKWRIANVTFKIFFQNNSSATSSVATCMPLLNYVWDTTDDTPPAFVDIMQYPTVKQYQFGNGASATGCMRTSGKPLAHLSSGEQLVNGLTGGTKPEKYGTWIDTTAPLVQHNSLKFFVDGFGASLATSEGQFSIYIDITYQCKDAL